MLFIVLSQGLSKASEMFGDAPNLSDAHHPPWIDRTIASTASGAVIRPMWSTFGSTSTDVPGRRGTISPAKRSAWEALVVAPDQHREWRFHPAKAIEVVLWGTKIALHDEGIGRRQPHRHVRKNCKREHRQVLEPGDAEPVEDRQCDQPRNERPRPASGIRPPRRGAVVQGRCEQKVPVQTGRCGDLRQPAAQSRRRMNGR